jgi:hypothetical protein
MNYEPKVFNHPLLLPPFILPPVTPLSIPPLS